MALEYESRRGRDAGMTRHLGLDMGGTAIKGVVLEHDGQSYVEVAKHVVDTRAHAAPAGIVEQLGEVGQALADEVGGIDTAGATIPGVFDLGSGVAHYVTNLGGAAWEGVPVRVPLRDALGVPTGLINDARAFGFAESRLGAARDCDTAAFFTLGTGVGGAIVVGRRLQLGYGSAGELGHTTVDGSEGAAVCGCGNAGCVEAYVRASAIAAAAGLATVTEVVGAAYEGDERALTALAEAGAWLGVAIANIVAVLNPERVVVGGGVAECGDLILEPARAEMRRRVRFVVEVQTEIVRTELGYEAGAVGAALWGAEAGT
jgi:glucokinase